MFCHTGPIAFGCLRTFRPLNVLSPVNVLSPDAVSTNALSVYLIHGGNIDHPVLGHRDTRIQEYLQFSHTKFDSVVASQNFLIGEPSVLRMFRDPADISEDFPAALRYIKDN